MIARHEGRVVLVSGAIPGERVRARVVRVAKGVAHADDRGDRRAVARSPRAVAGDPLCGGCLYGHIAYPRQLEIKSQVIADAFKRIGRLELPAPVAVAGIAGGRLPHARAPARARLARRVFREGTHDLCDARVTRQLLPATLDTLDRLMAAIRSIGAGRGARDRAVGERRRERAGRASRDRGAARPAPRREARVGRRPDAGPVRHRHDRDRRDAARSCAGTCSRSFRATATCCAIWSRT